MEQTILHTSKHFIQTKNLIGIQQYWEELLDTEFPEYVDAPTLFQKIYLHACLKGASEIASWLKHTIYPRLDPIMQIALRQVFPYGDVLLRKNTGYSTI